MIISCYLNYFHKFIFQLAKGYSSSFHVSKEGGYFTDASSKVSVMVPNNALQEPTTVRIDEVRNTNQMLLYDQNHAANLHSKLYDLQPHKKQFGNQLAIRFPLDQLPKRKNRTMLLYSASTQNEKASWVYFFKDSVEKEVSMKNELPQISWMIMNNFCVVMIDRFCLVALGSKETEEDRNKNVNRRGNGQVRGGIDPNNSNNNNNSQSSKSQSKKESKRRSQHNRPTPGREGNTAYANMRLQVKLLPGNQIQFVGNCTLSTEREDLLKAESDDKVIAELTSYQIEKKKSNII